MKPSGTGTKTMAVSRIASAPIISVARCRGSHHAASQSAKGTSHEAFLTTFFRFASIKTFETVDLTRDALLQGQVDLIFDDGIGLVFVVPTLLVVDKPAGLVVHPAAGNLDGTLVNALLHHCRGQLSGIGGVVRPGIVHRIDKETSGLLVVAKTDAAHEGLAKQFADHSIHRAYLAIVAGVPKQPSGTVSGHIGRSDHDRKKMAVLHELNKRGKHAVTHYRLIETLASAALVECRLETGRTHQVRVHMASIGHSLLGDPVYGRNPQRLRPILSQLHFARQALHAAELGFIHPVTGAVHSFASALPADMAGLLVELRKQS